MAVDCAHELKRHNVACVSLWPGAVQTETIMESLKSGAGKQKDDERGITVCNIYARTHSCIVLLC